MAKISNVLSKTKDASNFAEIANCLMNQSELLIFGNAYQICEIEMYLWNAKHHPDPFVHKDKHQLTNGKWYFHRANGKSYKDGTYKGLDLTFGDNHSFGGILIRSIARKESSKIIEGPCNVVKEMMSFTNAKKLSEFVDILCKNKKSSEIPLGAFGVNCKDFLYIKDTLDSTNKIVACPRVGLTLKKTGMDRNKYIMKHYRFVLCNKEIKKFKSGIVLAQYAQGINVQNVNLANKRYIQAFEQGKTKDFKDFEGKNCKVAELCQLYGLCCKNGYT